MSYKVVSTLFAVLISISAFSQKGYIATDSSLVAGVNLIKGTRSNNAKYIYLKTKSGNIQYTPEQIEEYGFRDGTTYKSIDILLSDDTRKKYFLEVINEGRYFSLYYLRINGEDYYYLQNNLSQTINAISKNEKDPGYLGSLLSAVSNNCNSDYKKVYLNRKFLSEIVRKVNQDLCPSPSFKNYGIFINGSLPSLSLTNSIYLTKASENESFSTKALGIGIFAEFPFWKYENLNLQLMLQYNDQQFVNGINAPDFDQDTRINLKFFSFSVLPTYKINIISNKFTPSFFFGPVTNYYTRSVAEFARNDKKDGIIIRNPMIKGSLDPFTIGGLSGIEMKWSLNTTRFISLQFSYEKQFGDKLNLNVFQSSLKLSL